MEEILLKVEHVSKNFGATKALEEDRKSVV